MSENHEPLQGGCSCGRNKYTVHIPKDSSQTAQVFFDSGNNSRRSHATPLSAWLRVPLNWYRSTTVAFLADESHSSIRRTYTSPQEESAKRVFCGFCGTPLSYWSESPPEEAEFISVTLGSLNGSDLRDLEELGLLPKEALEDVEIDKENLQNAIPFSGSSVLNGPANEGLPWFETLVKGSRLGKMTKGRGERRSGNGRFTVEWEIVEWTEGDDDNAEVLHPTGSKRKLGQVSRDEGDTQMSGAQ